MSTHYPPPEQGSPRRKPGQTTLCGTPMKVGQRVAKPGTTASCVRCQRAFAKLTPQQRERAGLGMYAEKR